MEGKLCKSLVDECLKILLGSKYMWNNPSQGKRVCLLHRETCGGGSPYAPFSVQQPLIQICISTLFETSNHTEASIMVVRRARGKRQRVSRNEYSLDENDQISNLPDVILLTILEKLPIEDVGRTSLLARRWKNLWKSISVIEFNGQAEKDGGKKASGLLKKLIRLHQGEKLKTFSVSVRYEGKRRAAYKSWMTFAASKNVEALTLELNTCQRNYSRPDPIVPLPDDLFNCSSLVRVKLTFANLDPIPPFDLKLLINLHLNKCQLPDDGVEIITANCAILKTLVLSNCNKDRDLKVTIAPGSILSKLIVEDKDFWNTTSKTSISAAKITALEILASNWLRKYSIDNIPDTVVASFSFEEMYGRIYIVGSEYETVMDVARVLEQLQPAKEVRLCTRSILTVIEMRERSMQFNMTHLELDTRLEDKEILGIILLLSACPQLELLVLTVKDYPAEYLDEYPRDWKSVDPIPLVRGASLAVVEFKNLWAPYQDLDKNKFDMKLFFQGCEDGLQLVNLLVSYAANLAILAFTSAHQHYEVLASTMKA